LQLNYTPKAAPISRHLAEHLAAMETMRLDLPSLLERVGIKDFSGSINVGISYTGQAGDLIMAAGSVDQSGTYVFEVQPQALSSTQRKLGSYWDLDDGSNTMYSLWNPTGTAQDVLVTLYYNGGSGKYKVPVHLVPQGSIMLDINNVVKANAPDKDGNVFPPNTSEGSAAFESLEGPTGQIKVIISGAVFNVLTGTCTNCCVPCCGTSDVLLVPSSDACFEGDATQFVAEAEQCDGSQFAAGGTWSSNNTAVATIDSSGLMSAVGVGSATLFFTANLPATSDCGQPLAGECPMTNFTNNVPIVAGPRIDSISPGTVTLGTGGVFTINGSGFLSGGVPTVSFDGTGIAPGTPTVDNDNRISLPYNVSCSATSQNVTFKYPSFDNISFGPFPVSVTLGAAPAPSIMFGGNPVTGTTQSVVVGQQIMLSSSVSLPACASISSQSWTIPNNPIKAYSPTPSSFAQGQVTPLSSSDLKAASVTIFWPFAASSQVVQYQYCIQDNQCPLATTTFNIAGPTGVIIDPNPPNILPVQISTAQDCSGNTVFLLSEGQVTTLCPIPGGANGMTISFDFDTQPSGGSFSWVQLVLNNQFTVNGSAMSCGTGLDKAQFPTFSQNPFTDTPDVTLTSTTTTLSRSFQAQTYLMWNSGLTNSIWVPLGSVTWQFNGTATQTTPNQWTLSAGSQSAGTFQASSFSQASNGFPTWSTIATNNSSQCTSVSN